MVYCWKQCLEQHISSIKSEIGSKRYECNIRDLGEDYAIITGNEVGWGVDLIINNLFKLYERMLFPVTYRNMHHVIRQEDALSAIEVWKRCTVPELLNATEKSIIAEDQVVAEGDVCVHLHECTFFRFDQSWQLVKLPQHCETYDAETKFSLHKQIILHMINNRLDIIRGCEYDVLWLHEAHKQQPFLNFIQLDKIEKGRSKIRILRRSLMSYKQKVSSLYCSASLETKGGDTSFDCIEDYYASLQFDQTELNPLIGGIMLDFHKIENESLSVLNTSHIGMSAAANTN